jgi:hypothetical protein
MSSLLDYLRAAQDAARALGSGAVLGAAQFAGIPFDLMRAFASIHHPRFTANKACTGNKNKIKLVAT